MISYHMIWDKMCRKNSDKIHVLFSPSLWLQSALLGHPGSLELACSWTTPQCESPQAELSPALKFREISWIRESSENSTEFLCYLKLTLWLSSQSWNQVKTSNGVGESWLWTLATFIQAKITLSNPPPKKVLPNQK